MLITGLIIGGLVIDLGGGPSHDRLGFRYWNNPGAFARAGLVSNLTTDRFLAIVSTFVQAAFSFQGMELVAIAASETENPRRNIAKAVRRVFWRIAIFYILGVIISGMLVAYNDDALLNSGGTATESPYVIAIQRAGIGGMHRSPSSSTQLTYGTSQRSHPSLTQPSSLLRSPLATPSSSVPPVSFTVWPSAPKHQRSSPTLRRTACQLSPSCSAACSLCFRS